MNSQVITLMEKKVLKKVRRTFYLVLKQKNLEDKIIDDLKDEVERRFLKFIKEIAPRLEKLSFDDPETAIKVILIKGIIKILNDLENEKKINLSKEDIKVIDDIFKEDNNNDRSEQNKKKKNFNDSNKNDPNIALEKKGKKENECNENNKKQNNN